MTNILNDIKGRRIIVAGDVMLDRYWWGSVNRISPEAPVPIVDLERTSVVPGGAANVAVNLAGLGVVPLLFGVCGEDAEAELLRGGLIEKAVNDRYLQTARDRQTTIKTRIVAHQQHVVRIDQESSAPISATMVGDILSLAQDALADADAVILSDYAKGFLTDELIRGMIQMARSRRIPILADPKGRDFRKYEGVTVITPNKREAAEATGIPLDEETVVAGRALMDLLSPQALLITEGEHGMTLFESDGHTHLDPVAQEVYDVTGAGDTVISVFAACLAAGASFLEAAETANLAAGTVIGHVGTTHITADELIAAQHEHAGQAR